MDRYWFFTWRTYGTWLPGQAGFVGYHHNERGERVIENTPGTPPADAIPPLAEYARQLLKCPAVHFNKDQAVMLLEQFLETARARAWQIEACAILTNHVHLVFGVPGDPDPSDMLRDWKSYGSRKLNGKWQRPASGTWWETRGSKRALKTAAALKRAIQYVLNQENALLIWHRQVETTDEEASTFLL